MKSKTLKNQGHARQKSRLTDGIRSPVSLGLLPSCLRGLAAALICCTALLLIASGIVYSLDDPNRYVIPASLTVLYLSCFFGGFVSTRYNRGGALVCGLLVSVTLLILLLAASLLLPPSLSAEHKLPLSLGLRGLAIAFSIAGSLMSTGQKKKRSGKK